MWLDFRISAPPTVSISTDLSFLAKDSLVRLRHIDVVNTFFIGAAFSDILQRKWIRKLSLDISKRFQRIVKGLRQRVPPPQEHREEFCRRLHSNTQRRCSKWNLIHQASRMLRRTYFPFCSWWAREHRELVAVSKIVTDLRQTALFNHLGLLRRLENSIVFTDLEYFGRYIHCYETAQTCHQTAIKQCLGEKSLGIRWGASILYFHLICLCCPESRSLSIFDRLTTFWIFSTLFSETTSNGQWWHSA